MAFAVDTKHLLDKFIPRYESACNRLLQGVDRGRRLQLHRVCVYATARHDATTLDRFHGHELDNPRLRAALSWQAEQGDDEDEVEVLHYLKQLAAMPSAPTKPGMSSRPIGFSKAGTITLVASVQSLTFASSTQEQTPSSFHRYSVRNIMARGSYETHYLSSAWEIPKFPCVYYGGLPKIVSTNTEKHFHSVIWFVQLDFLERSNWSTFFPSSPGKRRRTLNPFHHVSPRREEDTSRAHHSPDAKRFKGVRYRADRNRWSAEMKPPKSKNKVYFGEFQSQTDAARVVDVAFHHYNKPLNFTDTPQILSKQPSSAGLDAEEKLRLVKEQTEWMKRRLPSLPSTECTPLAEAAGVVASVQNCFEIHSTAESASGLRPFSAIGSSFILGSHDEADDAVSQPRPWVQALREETMEQIFDLAGHAGVVSSSRNGQSMAQRSATENAIAGPSDGAIRPEYCSGTLSNVVSSAGVEQAFGRMQSMCMEFNRMSPAPAICPVWNPGKIQGDAANGLPLEQHNFGCMCMGSDASI